jgi:Putative mono-oxygenase ydhR
VLYELKEVITMITALVQFQLPQPITRDKSREVFLSTAPRYRDTQGLLRKYYLLSQDGASAGGVYLWKSREDAERLYTNEWKTVVRERYGAPPSVTYFESPVIVDIQTHEILSDS